MPAAALNPAETGSRCRTMILESILNRDTTRALTIFLLYTNTQSLALVLSPRSHSRIRFVTLRTGRSIPLPRLGGPTERFLTCLKFSILRQGKAQQFVHDVVPVVVRPFAH